MRFQEAAGNRTDERPASTVGRPAVCGTTRSGVSMSLTASGAVPASRVSCSTPVGPSQPLRSRSSCRSASPRLTAKTASAPAASSCTATVSTVDTSP